VDRKGEIRNAYKILVGKLERKPSSDRSRLRWEDNIEIGVVVEWIQLAQNTIQRMALVNTV
jgi:hypothetical protein